MKFLFLVLIYITYSSSWLNFGLSQGICGGAFEIEARENPAFLTWAKNHEFLLTYKEKFFYSAWLRRVKDYPVVLWYEDKEEEKIFGVSLGIEVYKGLKVGSISFGLNFKNTQKGIILDSALGWNFFDIFFGFVLEDINQKPLPRCGFSYKYEKFYVFTEFYNFKVPIVGIKANFQRLNFYWSLREGKISLALEILFLKREKEQITAGWSYYKDQNFFGFILREIK